MATCRACSCIFDRPRAKYCPACGKKLRSPATATAIVACAVVLAGAFTLSYVLYRTRASRDAAVAATTIATEIAATSTTATTTIETAVPSRQPEPPKSVEQQVSASSTPPPAIKPAMPAISPPPVAKADLPPVPDIIAGQNIIQQVGRAVDFRILASGKPDRFEAQGLPEGLALDAASGTVRGSVARQFSGEVRVRAANHTGWGPYRPVKLQLALDPQDHRTASRLLSDAMTAIDQARKSAANLAVARESLAGNQRAGDAQGVATWRRVISSQEKKLAEQGELLIEAAKSFADLPVEVKQQAVTNLVAGRSASEADVRWFNDHLRELGNSTTASAALAQRIGR